MSDYVVSARKYRPHKFNDVVGQQHVTKTLKNALRTNQIGHSFLFTGPRGVGKTTTARILAKVLNCTNRTEDFEPCNTCGSCESFNANGSFNIQELDAASHNSVDDIRALVEQVRFAPQQGEYKIYIIDEVHMLSQSAFNAFLKTLEEPPPYAVFILATTEKHKIIPTILSRCQIFDFKRVGVEDMVQHLQYIVAEEKLEADEAGLHVIAQKADGALRDALSMFDRIVSFSEGNINYENVINSLNLLDYDTFFKITDALLIHDKNGVLNLFNDIMLKGFEGDVFMLGLASHFRDLLVSKNEATLALLEVPTSLNARYQEQAQLAADSFLLNGLNISNSCDVGYKAARNKRLHVELALLKICYLGMKKSAVELPEATQKKTAETIKPVTKTIPLVNEEVNEAKKSKKAPPKKESVAPVVEKKNTVEDKITFEQDTTTLEDSPVEELKHIADLKEDTAPTVEDQKEITAVEEPAPKIIKPGSALKLKHLNAQIGKAGINKTGTKKAAEEDMDESLLEEIDETTLVNAWNDIIENFEEGNSPALRQSLFTSTVSLKNKVVQIEVQGEVSRKMIQEKQVAITDKLKELCNVSRMKVAYIVNEIVDNSPRALTQQEQLQLFMEKNPAIKDLTDRFDLEIDYT